MRFHEYSNLLPAMIEQDFQGLVADIRTNGLIEEIVTLDGRILDGRHRFLACQEAGVPPRFRKYGSHAGESIDPYAWMMSKNVARRHLTDAQRVVLGAEMAVHLRKDKKRLPNGDGCAGAIAAKIFGIGIAKMHQALRIRESDAALWEKVKAGELPVGRAYRMVQGTLPVKENGRWKPPRRLYSDWEAWQLIRTVTAEFGWVFHEIQFRGKWRVQVAKRPQDILPWNQVRDWDQFKCAVQAAVQTLSLEKA